uniref:Metal-binding protein n=1 Tax=Oscillatoriales cyanobacterium SpSt-402 TaxID=2282168 RepID=A0A832M3F6_9CYAN
MKKSPKGRVVLNHSTHIPGLIPLLERLSQQEGIQTITPGVITTVRAHSPHFILRISVTIRGGFKLIARRGKTVQEVFVLTSLGEDALKEAIAHVL